jgi:hypothetical protein
MTGYPTCAPGFCWVRAWENARNYAELDYAQGWLTIAGSDTSGRPVNREVSFPHAWNVIRATGEIADPSRPPLYPGETYRYEPDPGAVPRYLLAREAARVRLARVANRLEAAGADPGIVQHLRSALPALAAAASGVVVRQVVERGRVVRDLGQRTGDLGDVQPAGGGERDVNIETEQVEIRSRLELRRPRL